MKILVVFDKASCRPGLHTGWGLSVLVGDSVLFDTGDDGEALRANLSSLAVDISRIRAVVLSHEHDDHTGGLWRFLDDRGAGVDVVGCPSFSAPFKKKVKQAGGVFVESRPFQEVAAGVFTTGEIAGAYRGRPLPEQSLVVRGDGGLSVLTGCAHPGIHAILKRVRDGFPAGDGGMVRLVAGGFHLGSATAAEVRAVAEAMRAAGVEEVGAAHCSGAVAERVFSRVFGRHEVCSGAGALFDA